VFLSGSSSGGDSPRAGRTSGIALIVDCDAVDTTGADRAPRIAA
jgi:hypothetical protein